VAFSFQYCVMLHYIDFILAHPFLKKKSKHPAPHNRPVLCSLVGDQPISSPSTLSPPVSGEAKPRF
jgi:hypothetical protein